MAKEYHIDKQKSDFDHVKMQGFVSDNKYRREKDKEYAELEKEIEALENQTEGEEEENEEQDSQESIEATEKKKDEKLGSDSNWKKRYSDLRSHAAKKENELASRIEALEVQLKKKDKVLSGDMSDDEFKDWLDKYPKVAAAMRRISAESSEEVSEEVRKTASDLAKEKAQLAKDRAYHMLLQMQPDFEDVVQTQEFQDWFADQSVDLQDLINKPQFNEDGAKGAASVIRLYKAETGLSEKKKKETTQKPKDSAAESVSRSKSNSPDSGDKNKTISESQVAAMSDREYEKMEEAILQAQREGNFIYDLSGAAR